MWSSAFVRSAVSPLFCAAPIRGMPAEAAAAAAILVNSRRVLLSGFFGLAISFSLFAYAHSVHRAMMISPSLRFKKLLAHGPIRCNALRCVEASHRPFSRSGAVAPNPDPDAGLAPSFSSKIETQSTACGVRREPGCSIPRGRTDYLHRAQGPAGRGAKKWSNEPVQPRFGGQNLRVFVKVAIREANPCRTQDVFCRSSSEKAIPAEEASSDPDRVHRSIFRLP